MELYLGVQAYCLPSAVVGGSGFESFSQWLGESCYQQEQAVVFVAEAVTLTCRDVLVLGGSHIRSTAID